MMLVEDEKEFDKRLSGLQKKAKRLIASNYFDYISLSELLYTILCLITNAKSHKDINYMVWNSNIMENTLDRIQEKLKEARRK